MSDAWHVGAELGLDLHQLWALAGKGETSDGAKIHVAILDSGAADTTGLPADRIDQFDPLGAPDTRHDPTDEFHGTQVASLLASDDPYAIGVAPAVRCSCFNIYDSQQQPLESNVIAALRSAMAMKVDLICCTFTLEQLSPELSIQLDAASTAMIPVVVSAGNSPRASAFPEHASGLICVAASTIVKTVWEGRRGPWTTIAAPGIELPASTPRGRSSFSGTSAAAPVATGVIALALAYAKQRGVEPWLRQELSGLLTRTANRVTNPPLIDGGALLGAISDKTP